MRTLVFAAELRVDREVVLEAAEPTQEHRGVDDDVPRGEGPTRRWARLVRTMRSTFHMHALDVHAVTSVRCPSSHSSAQQWLEATFLMLTQGHGVPWVRQLMDRVAELQALDDAASERLCQEQWPPLSDRKSEQATVETLRQSREGVPATADFAKAIEATLQAPSTTKRSRGRRRR